MDNTENKNFAHKTNELLVAPLRVIANIATITGLITLLFEVEFFPAFSQEVYVTRLAATAIAFIVLVLSNLKIGQKIPALLIHVLLLTIVASFSLIVYLIPSTLVFNSYVVGLLVFTISIFLSWDVINQIIVAVYYNLVFLAAIMLNKESLYFAPQEPQALLFVGFLSIMAIVASSINYKLRKDEIDALLDTAFTGGGSGESNELKNLIANLTDAVFKFTSAGKVVLFNKAFAKVLGYDKEKDLTGLNAKDELFVNDSEWEQFVTILASQGKIKNYRCDLRKKDGSTIIVRINSVLAQDENGAQFYEGTFNDVTHQIKTENERKDEIRKLKAQLEEKSKMSSEDEDKVRDEFIGNMSHEVKNPINSLLGFLTLIENGLYENKDEITELSHNAKTSALSLLDIINNIIDVSQIESGADNLIEAEFNLRDEIDKALSIVAASLREKGLDIKADIAADIPPVLTGDSTRYRQIVVNLLASAIKHTHEGSIKVTLTAATADKGKIDLETRVTDTSPGMRKDEVKSLLETKHSVGITKSGKQINDVKSIALAKQFTELMGGKLKIESSVGKGTVYIAALPLKVSERFEHLLEQKKQREEEQKQTERKAAARHRKPLSKVPRTNVINKRILLVEDNPISQNVELKILREVGYNVDAVSNGQDAVNAVRTNNFDLVLMDVEMADMDGITATKQIRALDSEANGIPIIAVTAHSSMKDREKCLAAGMNDYIAKPINIHFLKMTIDQWLTGD